MKRTWAYGIALFGGYILVACGGAGGGGGSAATCGNQVLESPNEACDGKELGGQTCKFLKFEAGQLACSPTCTIDTKGCCNSKCVNIGDTICDKNVLKTCTAQPSGCRDYVVTTDCGATNKLCNVNSGKAQCQASCKDACALAGAKQCNGAVLETCTLGADGCRDWVTDEDCSASGENCDATSGAAHCTTECANQCTNAGDMQCSGTAIQTCTASGGSCNSWVTTSDCSSQGKSCVVNSGTAVCGVSCNNKCNTAGTQTCLANVLNTCTADANGCLDYAATQDCTTTNTYCKLAGAGLAKCEPVCLDPCPNVGDKKCNANVIQACVQDPNGCKEWKVDTNCPTGQTCDGTGGTYKCITAPSTGEDCGTTIAVKGGVNTVNWTATANNYMLTTKPSCASSYTISGPDVVLSYTSPITGTVDFTVSKPASNYQVVAAAGGSCGSFAAQLACLVDYSNTTMGGSFAVTQGSNYFIYAADTTSTGTLPLANPLIVTITEIDCTTFAASALTLNPANGGTTTTLVPKLSVDFDTALKTNVGTVAITGNKGTNLSYNLASSNTQITWTNTNKTLNINPGVAFPAGEVVTVSLTGLLDNKCGKTINKPNWSFNIVTPPCSPGAGGMVGSTVTKQVSGFPITSEYYMATDNSPSGYVYIGGYSELWRVPKTNPSLLTNVHLAAGLTSTSHLGYGMLIDGNNVFTIDDKTTGTTGRLWRITTDGGASWLNPPQDFASFSTTPGDSFYSGVVYKGKIYLLTKETTSSVNPQIWSMSAAPGTLPTSAVLETSVAAGETYCSGIAMDDTNYYLTCGTGDHVVRVTRATGAVTVIANTWDLDSYYGSPIHAHDANGDGTADFLYFKGGTREVFFMCNPASATPYSDRLATWGTTGSSNYGLAFDATAKTLYALDDVTKELIVIK